MRKSFWFYIGAAFFTFAPSLAKATGIAPTANVDDGMMVAAILICTGVILREMGS